MSKRNKEEDSGKLNRIGKGADLFFNIVFLVLALLCIAPVIFVFIISLSSKESLVRYGYQIIPKGFSADSYLFLWRERATLFRALGISIFVTVAGTIIGLFLTTTMGYCLSRKNYKMNSLLAWVVFIPMIFNGGMLSSYVINTNLLGLKNNILALILPIAVSSFHVIICKTFFRTTIPDSIIESAKIDGASQYRIFAQMVIPMSKPVLATIGLFLTFGYWNDWFLSSLYISDKDMQSLQALLNNIQKNIEYLAKNPAAGVSLQQYKNMMPQEGVRMAIAVVIVVPIACAYPFFQKYFVTGLTIGAVKG